MTDVLIDINDLRKLYDEIDRLKSIVVEDIAHEVKAAHEIEKLNKRYADDLEAWRENNRYHAAEIERLKEIIRARENEV